jgi:uncharacterized membrane protein
MKKCKNIKIFKFFAQLIVVFLLLSFFNVSYSAPKYNVVDIHLAGTETHVIAINDHRQIVGSARDGTNLFPLIWKKGKFIILDEEFPQGGLFNDINNSGQIVGRKDDGTVYNSVAVLYEKGRITILDMIGETFCSARGINKSGQIVGACDGKSVLWEDGVGTILLPSYGYPTGAMGINDLSQIVHQAPEGFLISQDNNIILNLDVYVTGRMSITNGVINNLGQTSGTFHDAYEVPCIWDINGNRTDIVYYGPPYSTRDAGEVYSVNDLIQAVGYMDESPGGRRFAFLWEKAKLYDLNDLIPADSGWILELAYDINNKGDIIGHGSLNDERRSFLLTPIKGGRGGRTIAKSIEQLR